MLAGHCFTYSQARTHNNQEHTTYTMAALELAQHALSDTPVPKKFLDGLVEKGYLSEEKKDTILDDEDLCRFIMKRGGKGPGRKSRSRSSASDEERDNAEYDPLRCSCRIWKPLDGCGDVAKGMNIQCSKKLPDDMSMCKMHSGKLDGDGLWWLGLVTEDPPVQPFFQPGKKKAHYWSLDAKEEDKAGRLSGKKPGKKPKKVEEPESDEEVDHEEVDHEEDAEKKRLERKEKMAKMKAQKKKSSMEKGSKKPSKKKTSLEEQQEKIAAAAEKRATAREAAKKKFAEEESDEELDADEDGNTPYIFEGVKYLKTEDGDIVDPDTFDLMGEDDGVGGIDWSDSEMLEKHEEKRDSLK